MDPYANIEDFEKSLIEWEKGRLLKERTLFRKMMNLILTPLRRSERSFSVGKDKSAELLLITRMFNDFEAAIRLTLMGLGEQAYMPIRDSIETMLLLKLFGVDSKLAKRWMVDLNEYHASSVIALLKERGIDFPLNEMYSTFSQLGHPNLLASLHVAEETNIGENQLFRAYHFGGMRNEGFMELQLKSLLNLQMVSLIEVLAESFYAIDSEFESWWEEVRSLPLILKKELGMDVEIEEEPPTDRISRQIYLKLKVPAFKASSVNQIKEESRSAENE